MRPGKAEIGMLFLSRLRDAREPAKFFDVKEEEKRITEGEGRLARENGAGTGRLSVRRNRF